KMRELIVLQRDQRRDDDGRSAEHQPGELVDGGLAAAGREDGEHIAPRDRGRDSAQLSGPQVLEAESRAGELDDPVVVDSWRSSATEPGPVLTRFASFGCRPRAQLLSAGCPS